jgi:hypothetical protein
MDWRSTVAVGAGLGLAACAGERGLDDKHLPAAVRGLVPGSATEAEVRAAWPEAGPPTRDRTFGGAGRIELNDQPAVMFELAKGFEAWLVEVRGTLTLVLLEVPITEDCKQVLAAMGDRWKDDTCRYSNRVPGRDEHRGCARTRDGELKIAIRCHDRQKLVYWVHWNESTYRSVSRLGAATKE